MVTRSLLIPGLGGQMELMDPPGLDHQHTLPVAKRQYSRGFLYILHS